jgi:DNA-binding NarL/FixJ family response regulator
MVVLRRQLTNSAPTLVRALRAYRHMTLRPANQDHSPRHRPVRTARRLSPKEIRAAVEAYKAGATAREIGERLGVDRRTISGHLKAVGVRLRLSPLTPEEAAHAAHLYAGGLSMAQVGERLGRSNSLIRLTLKRAGIRSRDSHGQDRP